MPRRSRTHLRPGIVKPPPGRGSPQGRSGRADVRDELLRPVPRAGLLAGGIEWPTARARIGRRDRHLRRGARGDLRRVGGRPGGRRSGVPDRLALPTARYGGKPPPSRTYGDGLPAHANGCVPRPRRFSPTSTPPRRDTAPSRLRRSNRPSDGRSPAIKLRRVLTPAGPPPRAPLPDRERARRAPCSALGGPPSESPTVAVRADEAGRRRGRPDPHSAMGPRLDLKNSRRAIAEFEAASYAQGRCGRSRIRSRGDAT